MDTPPRSKDEHLRRLVAEKQLWSEPLAGKDKAAGFRGWHERGYLPHCDKPGLVQFVTFRLWDSMPASRKGEWEHLLAISARSDAPRSGADRSIASREQRVKLEEHLDSSLGECFLREPRVAALVEKVIRFHHGRRFELLAWVVMPNHVHALIQVGQTPLTRIVQNWKSIVAVEANKLLGRTGRFWQPDYWDRYMRDAGQATKAVRYVENNPVKANFCRTPEDWPFSSARCRNLQTRQLQLSP